MNELVVAVVPIRSFSNGKTRLSPVLSSDERAEFLRGAASRVINAALDSQVVDTVLVVSPDPEALTWAGDFGRRVHGLEQPANLPGLNGAMHAAREWAIERDADSMLSIFADLPRLTKFDIRRLLARHGPVVFGPDRRGEGTNVMLLRLQGPGARFQFAFGERSLEKHLKEARRLGLSAIVQDTPGIGFDLDTPGDWADYLGSQAPDGMAVPPAPVLVACGACTG